MRLHSLTLTSKVDFIQKYWIFNTKYLLFFYHPSAACQEGNIAPEKIFIYLFYLVKSDGWSHTVASYSLERFIHFAARFPKSRNAV